MPAISRVLKHVRIDTAKAKRKCHRKQNEHSIRMGEVCLVIKDHGRNRNYCLVCALPILQKAQADLDLLMAGLYGGDTE
ncbi:MAG: hypothetical protein OXQ32_12805 [bacterium]|nr:hypothetical protein [bacterium]